MTTIRNENQNQTNFQEGSAEGSNNLWESFLKNSSDRQILEDATLLFLGDATVGKSCLVDRFCGGNGGNSNQQSATKTTPAKNQNQQRLEGELTGRPVISFSYFNAIDDDSEFGDPLKSVNTYDEYTAPRVNVWSLSDPTLKSVVAVPFSGEKESSTAKTAIMIGLDMSCPWTIEESLEKWLVVAKENLDNINKKLTAEQCSVQKDEVYKYLQRAYNVKSSATDSTGAILKINKSNNDNENDNNILNSKDLPDSTLEINLGIPLIIICLKADTMKSESFEEEQQLQFIQQYIRRFCLKHGAALFYISARDGTNCLALKNYLLHRFYPENFSFHIKAEGKRETLYIPAGWDSEGLINSLSTKKMSWTIDSKFSDIIKIPQNSDIIVNKKSSNEDETELDVKLETYIEWLEMLQEHIKGSGMDMMPLLSPRKSKEISSSGYHKDTTETDPDMNDSTTDNDALKDFFEGLLA